MRRLSSTLVLSLWLGFHGTVAGVLLSPGLGLALDRGPEGSARFTELVAAGGNTTFVGLMHAALALLFAASAVALHARGTEARSRGELLAFAAVGISTAMVVAAFTIGAGFAPIFGNADYAASAILLSLAALAFDRLIDIPEDNEDDAAFHRAVRMIRASVPSDQDARGDLDSGGEKR